MNLLCYFLGFLVLLPTLIAPATSYATLYTKFQIRLDILLSAMVCNYLNILTGILLNPMPLLTDHGHAFRALT